MEKATHYFPFSLKIIDRRLYVLKNFKLENTLPVGSEILSINGHSAEEVLNTLLPTIPSDGYIQTMASVVATFMKNYNRAIFIGEESGGTMEGNTSNEFALLQLPNTKIRVEIPLIKKGNNVDFIKGRGVFPDYLIPLNIEDIIKGNDTELNFALKLITSQE